MGDRIDGSIGYIIAIVLVVLFGGLAYVSGGLEGL